MNQIISEEYYEGVVKVMAWGWKGPARAAPGQEISLDKNVTR